MFYEFKKLISKFKNVNLILPSQNMEESLEILRERLKERDPMTYEEYHQINEHFIRAPYNYELAKNIVYTNGKDIKSIIEEINSLSFGQNEIQDSVNTSNGIRR